jgi:hypothetical protein
MWQISKTLSIYFLVMLMYASTYSSIKAPYLYILYATPHHEVFHDGCQTDTSSYLTISVSSRASNAGLGQSRESIGCDGLLIMPLIYLLHS